MNTPTRMVVLLGLLAALAVGYWWGSRKQAADSPGETVADSDVIYWYDPMRPDIHFDKPGRSPFMDMDLVPKKRTAAASESLSIDPRTAQNFGIRTVRVVEGSLAPSLVATGVVAVDERRLTVIAPKVSGWLERLDVRAQGDPVRRGQRIGRLYSPQFLAAQEELLLALRSNDQDLVSAGRRLLEVLGAPRAQVDSIVRAGQIDRAMDLIAPASGVVMELSVREGSAVTGGETIMQVADLAELWVIAEVPESRGSWLSTGGVARILPVGGQAPPIHGRIDYVYPELSASTRTLRVRIVVANVPAVLRVGMSARVEFEGPARPALLVPSGALIRTGNRTVAILAEEGGRFRPTVVDAGLEQDEQTEIRSGLSAGDRVVASGQFLIDSEASLRGVLDRLVQEPEGGQP